VLNRILKHLGREPARGDSDTVIFTPEKLKALAGHPTYKTAEPYPNLVMDDFFEPEALDKVLAEWPDATRPDLEHHNDGTYVRKKTGSSSNTKFGPFTRRFLHRLGEPDFLQALEEATGIWGLIPDPYLFGGGIHQTQSGGKLAIHADFNKHFKLPLDRRLNLLVYLNKDWTEDNGGWFEMWDHEMKGCVKRVLPTFNRMAIFSTTDFSYHGQPEEIVGPPTLYRRSIALYYYSVGRPEHEVSEQGQHSTLWRERPDKGY
jgi:hypothetical protein